MHAASQGSSGPTIGVQEMPSFLIEAFQERRLTEVEKMIQTNPSFLCIRDIEKNNILHYALEFGDIQLLNFILKNLDTYFPQVLQEMLLEANVTGWNMLHSAARFADLGMFDTIVQRLERNIFQLAKQITVCRSLPLQLVDLNKSSGADKIREELENLTLSRNSKPLHELIDANDVKNSLTGNEKRNQILLANLQIATEVANSVRATKIVSNTHPSLKLTADTYEELRKKIEDLRKIYNQVNLKVIPADDPYYLKKLQNICDVVNQFKVGNCGEMSYLAMKILIERDFQDFAELYEISDGDHVFVVIGRDPYSNPFDYRTWGENAVVIDSWAGEVYPASQIPTKLKAFFRYKHAQMNMCILCNFHSQFHHLSPLYDYFALIPNKFNRLHFHQVSLIAKKPNIIEALKNATIAITQIHSLVLKLSEIGNFDYSSLWISSTNVVHCDLGAILRANRKIKHNTTTPVDTDGSEVRLDEVDSQNEYAKKALLVPEILEALKAKKLDIHKDLNKLDEVSLKALIAYVSSKLFQEKELSWGNVQSDLIFLWIQVMQYRIQEQTSALTHQESAQFNNELKNAWHSVFAKLSTTLNKLAFKELTSNNTQTMKELRLSDMQMLLDSIGSCEINYADNKEILLFLQKMKTDYLNSTMLSFNNESSQFALVLSMGYALLEAKKIFLESFLRTDNMNIYDEGCDVDAIDKELYDAFMCKERIDELIRLKCTDEAEFANLMAELRKCLSENNNNNVNKTIQHSLRWKNSLTPYCKLYLEWGFFAKTLRETCGVEVHEVASNQQQRSSMKRKFADNEQASF